jgi:predicted DNA-binding WGR domain protein
MLKIAIYCQITLHNSDMQLEWGRRGQNGRYLVKMEDVVKK